MASLSPDSEANIHALHSSRTNLTEWSSVPSHRLRQPCMNDCSRLRIFRTSYAGRKNVTVAPRSRMSGALTIQSERLTAPCLTSRHNCHYKMDLADVFRYMATFIKISNHLALILPGTYSITPLFGVGF
jgi:hypothetical protein